MKHIKLLKSLIIVAPVLALASPLIILSNTGCGNPNSGPAANGSNWVGRTGGTLDYTINDIDHTYTITGNNNFTANSNFTIPDFVTVNNKEYSVTTISNSAFYECTGLKGVNFGSVTTINDNAFSGCTGLTTIDFGSVTSMGEYAFWECTGLTSVNLSNVTSIGNSAFYGCPLEEISVGPENEVFKLVGDSANGFIQKISDDQDTTLNPACGYIGGIACGKIVIPDGFTTIGFYAFQGCAGVTEVDFSSVASIGELAFRACTGLTEIDCDSVTTMGAYAFQGCTGLTELALNNVTTIGDAAFWGCPLEEISVDPANTIYKLEGTSTDGFIQKISDDEGTTLNPACGNMGGIACGNIAIPEDFTTFANHAFYQCAGITAIDLRSVTTLGLDWCNGCLNLSSVTIGTQTYSSSGYGWDQVGPATNCTLYASSEDAANTFKTSVIHYPYSIKWNFQQI